MHDHSICVLSWSPDGRRLASAANDKRIRIWNPDSWEMVVSINAAHGGEPHTVAWSPDGKVLASGGQDRLVKLWDVATGSLLNVLRGHQSPLTSVCWWPQHGLLLSGGWDGAMTFWGPQSEQTARAPRGSTPLAWSPDGRQAAFGKSSRDAWRFSVCVASSTTFRVLEQIPYTTNTQGCDPFSVAWSPDTKRLAIGYIGYDGANSGPLQVWDLQARKEVFVSPDPKQAMEVRSVMWSPDGRLVLAACLDGTARLWNPGTRECVLTFRAHKIPLSSACWHPDGRRIASKDFDGGVLVWEGSTGRILLRLRCAGFGPGMEHQVLFNPRGDLLAAGSGDGAVMMWDAETGREIHVLRGHTSNVRSVSWSPDGRRLASAGEDRTIRIWDVRSGQELLVLASPWNPHPSVSWSPDGRRIGTADDEVRIYDATVGYELGAGMTPGAGSQ
jgi:WD40 repeat protein